MNTLEGGKRLGLSISLVVCAAAIHASADPIEDTRRILDNWSKREKTIQTLRVYWDDQVTVSAGAERPGVPAEAVSFHSIESLTLKGDWMRLERRGLGYSEREHGFVNQRYISTYDGTTSKAFCDLGNGGWKIGFVMNRQENQDFDNYHMRPMKIFARPVSPKFTFFNNPSAWKWDSAARLIQGSKCRALTREMSGSTEAYWVDPSKDDSVVLYELTTSGVVLLCQEFSYNHDIKFGYVPAKWTTTRRGGNNAVLETDKVAIKRHEFNRAYDKSEFDIIFPEGTEVRDDLEGRFYLLGKDGTKQDIKR